ncbi:MAG: MFS transporter [Micropruina sp.]
MTTATTPTRTSMSARNGDLVVFGANGFVFASWMSRVPDVKQLLDITAGQLSLLLLAISVGSLCGLPLAGRIAHRLGASVTVRLGALLALPGIVLAALAVEMRAPLLLIAPAMVLIGLGIGVWDVAQNLEGTIIERTLGRAIMPWFHALFSAGTVVGALIGAGLTWLRVPLGVHLSAAAVLTLIAVWWGTGRFLLAFDEDGGDHAASAAHGRSPWLEPRTLLIGVMVLAAAFTEGVANDWLALAFVEGYGLDNSLGVVALAVFLAFMTGGRIVGAPLLDRYGRVVVLRVLFAAAVVGCLLVVFGSPWLAFVGAAIWGVGASLGFPVGMSAAADDPARAAVRLSVVSTIGYGAFLTGPVLIGFLGDHFGVLRALLVVAAVCLAAILVVPVARPLPASEPATEEP